jgi:hypothetical protein
MLCSYSFNKLPENLYLKVTVSASSAEFSPATTSASPFPIQGGNCNKTPPSTLSFVLSGGQMLCGDNAFNVNLRLQALSMATRPTGVTGPLINRPAATLLSAKPQVAGGMTSADGGLLSTARAGGDGNSAHSIGGSGGYTGTTRTTAKDPGLVGISSVNGDGRGGFTSGAKIGGTGGFTGGIRPDLPFAFTGGVKVVAGKRVTSSLAANSSIVVVLRQQRQSQTPSGEHTLASGSISPILAANPSNLKVKAISPYTPSSLLTAQENTWCQQNEAQGGAPAIFRVAGKTKGLDVVYSPYPQANPYNIVGCGFGNSTGSARLELGENTGTGVSKPLYALNLVIQSWSDHQIVASLDPNTSHVPDWSGGVDVVYIAIQSAKGRTAAGPGQFYAARQTVPLSSVPQDEASLYQQGSPYFLSPVSNYYGLNGTVGVMRQGLPANTVAGQDNFTLQLAPGFIVNSTQTDLLVSNTFANVTFQPATVKGNTITVTYPVLSSGSGNSANYYSIYGLTVWVTGPAGVLPIMPAP